MSQNQHSKFTATLFTVLLTLPAIMPAQTPLTPEQKRQSMRYAQYDLNRDGWDDNWQKKFPAYIADKAADPDGDGISNFEEMLDGTDPSRANKKNEVYVTPEEQAKQTAAATKSLEIRTKDWEAHLVKVAETLRPNMAPGELSTAEEKQVVEAEFTRLRAQAAVSATENAAKDQQLDELARRLNVPREIQKEGGGKLQLSGEVGGAPAFIGSHNYFAAAGINADEVWPDIAYIGRDFTTNYNLTGNGQTLGMWEVDGGVRTTHQEFGIRAVQRDSAAVDGNGHATQVAGTMAGAGAIHLFGLGNEDLTRGVAYEARVFANDTANFKTEREAQAAGNVTDPPLFSSNDSWGFLNGWRLEDIDATATVNNQWVWWGALAVSEDPKFGLYLGNLPGENGCTQIDSFHAIDALRHLMVFSCGNDRGQGPGSSPGTYYTKSGTTYTAQSAVTNPHVWSDGDASGYDTVSAPGTAKNVLTVGAVEDVVRPNGGGFLLGFGAGANVVPATFTGFGPTDDGRIKPDLVAVGTGNAAFRTWFFGTAYNILTPSFSSTAPSNNGYFSTSGTSFSAPAVTGGFGLILEHRAILYPALTNADAWRNSTLKAIAIETCDDVGTAGPDYRMGHGIFNVRRCCDLVSADRTAGRNSLIKEVTLPVSSTLSWLVTSTGATPLSVTAAWSDPAGTAPSSAAADPTNAVLVNNLDLKVEYLGADTTVYPAPATGTAFLPWVLNPDLTTKSATTRALAATRAMDNRNNVERVSIATPTAGLYRVTLSHAGGISGSPAASTQVASLALTGSLPRIGRINQVMKAPSTPSYTLSFDADPDAFLTVQTSTDMINWTNSTTVHASATSTANTVVVSAGGAETRRFWRLYKGP